MTPILPDWAWTEAGRAGSSLGRAGARSEEPALDRALGTEDLWIWKPAVTSKLKFAGPAARGVSDPVFELF